jgi:hypothetical protein
MKKILVVTVSFFLSLQIAAQDLSYYLPNNVSYNLSIPKPKEIIYHEVGEFHVTHDRLVNYMKAIATAAPDRVKLETMGLTFESRPQVLLIISAKKNLDRLEQIREQHLQLCNTQKSTALNINDMPIVVYIGHSIHGNEPSGSNAALVSAYYLAAAQGKEIDELLENTVILFDPSFNPDGLQRFSTWANQHKSKNLVTDPNSREFNEVWPGGRFNHYWFDLNRDWLPAVHVESQNRLKWYHNWQPNILTDHHEQGSNASFFFQPGVPSRVNPLTPAKNQELSAKLGKFHAKYLDKIGSLYFTKENYDDFYYGKGSTFPDINGGVGILFEQASSRGHAQQTANGILQFSATIKNQFVTTLSTLEGAVALRKEFLEFQRSFYQQSALPDNNGYVFGDKNDKAKTFHFIQMLQRHNIEVNELAAGYKDGEFEKGTSYAVALHQPQKVLIKAIFDKQLNFTDSLFYDITSWTMPLAFGMPYKETVVNAISANVLPTIEFPKGEVVGTKSDYAYLFEWDELYAPKALYELQQAGLITKVATNPFSINTTVGNKKFDYGTILLPVKMQSSSTENMASLVQTIAQKNGLKIYALQSGNAIEGSDLGSSKFISLNKPTIAMLVGQGVNATDAGEVWHLLDQRMNITATHLEIAAFNRVELNNYNTIIMLGGTYTDLNKDKLKTWVQNGGNLILLEEAVTWASQNGVNNVVIKKIKSPVDSTQRLPYVQQEQITGAQQMNGAIFEAVIDNTHPLVYGYNSKTVSMFKANKVFMEKSKNPFATPFYFGNSPLQSGWASTENLAAVKNSASVIVNTVGNGRIINIGDNPNFRGFWLGGTKLMMNAVFFGKIIDGASGRGE